MKEFQHYTRVPRAARWRRSAWSLPILLGIAALAVGLAVRAGAAPTPLEMLRYGSDGGSESAGASQKGWAHKLLGGSADISGGPLTVLVLGVDRRPDAEYMGVRSDTIMLVQFVPEQNEIKLLSIPRDLFVQVAPGVHDRINTAYAYGGTRQAVSAVEAYTGVPIDHYAIVDFEGFEAIVNELGGVKLEVRGDEFPDHMNMPDGVKNISGHKALLYARYRGTAGGDLDRIERQQQLVAALRSKALRWNTLTRLPEILKIADENVDTDLGFDRALTLGNMLVRGGRDDQMTAVQLEGTPQTLPNGDQVLFPNAAQNEAILQEFRP